MDVNGEDALKVAEQELVEKKKGSREMGDYQTAKDKGEKQPEFLKALDSVDRRNNMQLFNACKRGAGRDEERGGACSRGLACPNK
eukprot:4089838-Pyramimonas_sp.AAC.1